MMELILEAQKALDKDDLEAYQKVQIKMREKIKEEVLNL